MPVFRCPACRSLDVARNAEKSAYEFTYMECAACGNGELVDWVDREAWVIVVQDQEEARAAAVAREEAAAQQTAALLAAARVAVAARAAAAAAAELPRLLVACVGQRRFLARTRLSEPPWWRDGGFVILPHD